MKVFATFLLFLGVALACDSDEYDCGAGNGYCIPDNWECDGWDDCSDGVDESNCGGTGPQEPDCVLAHQRPCDNGGCVPLNWVCDGMDDCGDNSDEENCPGVDPGPLTPTQCSSTQFECANGHCTYASWVCDGDNDCGDWSDEQSCSGGNPDPDPGCPSDRFECDNGRCILAHWECDGYDDCSDNSDEDHCPGGGGINPVVNPETPCGGQLKEDAGVITHLNYDNGMDCEWEISVSDGNYVYMEFTSFELESASSSSGTCNYDHVEIYDGLSNDAPLLAKLCGDELPKPIQSTGNRVSVQFKSDVSITKDGFEMRYYAVAIDDGSGEGSGSSVVDARDQDAFIF
ncbi:uncharacterized protein LOC144862022 isoform X1 [Branchiostoma floridae x Branchiostoma japonicum]